jgi:hypothetical protein
MPRDYTELPTTPDGRPMGAWALINLIDQLPARDAGKCEKAVLKRVAHNESLRDGVSRESVTTIAELIGFSRRATGVAITSAVRKGMLRELGPGRWKGSGAVPVLQVEWEVVQQLAEVGKAERLARRKRRANQEEPSLTREDELDPFALDDGADQICVESAQVDELDGEACGDSEQADPFEDKACAETTQVRRATCAECSQVGETYVENAHLAGAEDSADKVPTTACAKPNPNLRKIEPGPAQFRPQTNVDSAHKGFEGSSQGIRQGALRDSIALGCRYPQPQTPPVTPSVEETADEREPLLPGSTLTASEIEARRRFVEEMRPAWARRAG